MMGLYEPQKVKGYLLSPEAKVLRPAAGLLTGLGVAGLRLGLV